MYKNVCVCIYIYSCITEDVRRYGMGLSSPRVLKGEKMGFERFFFCRQKPHLKNKEEQRETTKREQEKKDRRRTRHNENNMLIKRITCSKHSGKKRKTGQPQRKKRKKDAVKKGQEERYAHSMLFIPLLYIAKGVYLFYV